MLSSLSFPLQFSLGTELEAGFLLGARWALLLVGILYALFIPPLPLLLFGPHYISRALVQFFSASVNLVNKAWESEQNCSSANMSSI